MKSSKEIADTVFKIRDEYLERQRKRNIKIRRITSFCSAACLCGIVLVCANNMHLPSVGDWISPSAESSNFETNQNSTTIKIITSEDISEFSTTDNINNETPSESSLSTDIREENKNTERSDDQNTITTAKSDSNGNNIKTTKHSGTQNTVTTRKTTIGSGNNTKTTKRSTNQNAVTTRKPTTNDSIPGINTNPKTTKHSEPQTPVTTSKYWGNESTNNSAPRETELVTVPVEASTTMSYVTKPVTQATIKPYETTTVACTVAVTVPVTVPVEVTESSLRPLDPPTIIYVDETYVDETELVKTFAEIEYNDTTYQAMLMSGVCEQVDYDEIDSYIGDMLISGFNSSYNCFYSAKCEFYTIKNVPIEEGVAVKFKGYDTYFNYFKRRG